MAQSNTNNPNKFPYDSAKPRLTRYNFNKQLFSGDHFSAFNIKIDNRDYNKVYAQLRYVVNNFAGLLSKVSADFLFSEAPIIRLPVIDQANPYNKNDDKKVNPNADAKADAGVFKIEPPKPNPNQEWLENLLFDNRLDVQLYESALTNSYKGDAIFKLRVGPLRDSDQASIVIEQVMPDYYFPDLDNNNVSADPKRIEIAFVTEIASKKYLRKEVHTPGLIKNQLFELDGEKIVRQVPLTLLNDPDLKDEEDTGVDRLLVVHVPNWSDGTTHFGLDDYQDLTALFYALNNRMTLIDNILDKHADPILAVPEGVLDEEGNIDRSKVGVYEKTEGGETPEYIVWDAKLDSSFKEIDALLEALYMYSETSPSVFGNTSGNTAKTESGRALKYRLMRTVAKIKRKQRYYDYAIKEIVYLAELLAKAHNIPAMGVSFQGEPEVPSLEWPDPIPVDSYEQAEEEELRLASGNQSLRDSIKNIDKVDDAQAVQKIQEIRAEQQQLNPAPVLPAGTAPQSVDAFGKDVILPKTTRPPERAKQ